jgi:hypothetical protein
MGGASFEERHGQPDAETISLPRDDPFEPRPISAGNLVSLIDLGWSDYWIARYFGVQQSKLSGLRAYYGLSRVGLRERTLVSAAS